MLDPQTDPMDATEQDMAELMAVLGDMRLADVPEDILALIPEELREQLEQKEADRKNQLQAFSISVARHRDEAIKGKIACGIEDDWDEDQDAYEGVDDANRHESTRHRRQKPGSETPRKKGAGRSNVFSNITGPYCDAAAARMGEILLPSDDKPYSIKPTPIPELQALKNSQEMVQNPDGTEVSVAELIDAEMELARERAELAERRITDWLVEGRWHGEVREVIDDAARLGTGVLKGPVPVMRKYRRAARGEDGSLTLVIEEEISPESKRVDCWDAFPDPACGDDIQNGRYFLERDRVTPKQLQELMDDDSYMADQIAECLREGPQRSKVMHQDDANTTTSQQEKYEIWYYYGCLAIDDMESADADLSDYDGNTDLIPAVITMVNDTIIKASVSHLESGEYPYDFLPWKKRKGMPWGSGVSRALRTPQRMINAATRMLMDNSGVSSIPMFISKKGLIFPASGSNYEAKPGKHWQMGEDADIDDVRKAFAAISIDSKQAELMGIIQHGMKLAEDVTGLPMIMQGQQGKAPDTVGGMQILNNNANGVLRRLAKGFDDYITEPHLRRYYEWLMIYGPEEEKGDYTVDAKGSSALVEREIQNQAIIGMGQIAADPRFGMDPKKWAREMAKAQRLNPDNFMLDEEEGQQIPPEVQEHIQMLEARVQELEGEGAKEQIRADAMLKGKQIDAQSRIQVKQLDIQARQRKEQMDARRADEKMQLEAAIAQKKAQLEEIEKRLKDDQNAIRVAELRLQRDALRNQIQRDEKNMAAKVNQGSRAQTIHNDRYGKVPHAIG